MKFLCSICCLFLLNFASHGVESMTAWNSSELTHDPDVWRNVSELISSKDYPVEEHIVETKDGFLLSVQRIPHGRIKFRGGKQPVAYLQHGLLSAASDWVINFPEQSLGFLLADLGYDVWLGNTRGNVYSKHHIKLDPSMAAFWNYSFDEMATYDLPAIIDYVLNETNQNQLFYIGHSQGTTSAFALLSENPSYNKKIKLFIALAPVTNVGYMRSPILVHLAPFSSELDYLAELFGIKELLPNGPIVKFLSELCDMKEKFLCENLLFLISGFDYQNINETRLGVYVGHFPDSSSVKSLIHYGQLVNSKMFRKFDYGKQNQQKYNQSTPPVYDVSKISTPTALFWSINDQMADFIDVTHLQTQLKSLVMSYCVPNTEFSHADFVIADTAKKFLYDQVIALMNKYL